MGEAAQKKQRGRPKKDHPKLVNVPVKFEADPEHDLTEMQSAFVWFYTEGACGQTEAARKAGYSFPAASATKLLNGVNAPNVTRAIRIKQDELREKYAVTPEKTGSMLWNIPETAFEAGAYNAAVSAVKELNQLAGLTVHRSQNLNINADLQRMDRDDIKARLNELLGVQAELSPKDR